ncbi:hypothetical protein Mal15_41910 [Stieleria maiorica]|uniref:DUF3311 domain-containing protein n=1 Tax=Stieleria maiorica TaxID=2795974 RepID=A0A5B9MFU8_9BACT|nr:DUF3311 domain-containing protein [Stieleria maiorica]QEG00122.1 hypothetical protein Mal15_41910 [Stieleria maiorica]
MKYLVWGLVVLLVILHHDLWNWDNDRLVLGFLPVTLAYHAGISVAASIVWFMATKFAWPNDLEEMTESATTAEEAEALS